MQLIKHLYPNGCRRTCENEDVDSNNDNTSTTNTYNTTDNATNP